MMINSNAIGKINPFKAPTVTNIFTGCPMMIKTIKEINTKKVSMKDSFLLNKGCIDFKNETEV